MLADVVVVIGVTWLLLLEWELESRKPVARFPRLACVTERSTLGTDLHLIAPNSAGLHLVIRRIEKNKYAIRRIPAILRFFSLFLFLGCNPRPFLQSFPFIFVVLDFFFQKTATFSFI